jgi:hypothetical protein
MNMLKQFIILLVVQEKKNKANKKHSLYLEVICCQIERNLRSTGIPQSVNILFSIVFYFLIVLKYGIKFFTSYYFLLCNCVTLAYVVLAFAMILNLTSKDIAYRPAETLPRPF